MVQGFALLIQFHCSFRILNIFLEPTHLPISNILLEPRHLHPFSLPTSSRLYPRVPAGLMFSIRQRPPPTPSSQRSSGRASEGGLGHGLRDLAASLGALGQGLRDLGTGSIHGERWAAAAMPVPLYFGEVSLNVLLWSAKAHLASRKRWNEHFLRCVLC